MLPPFPTLLLVPTEAHVEVALAAQAREGRRASVRVRSARGFVREAAAALVAGATPATPLAVALATHVAVKEVARERLLPGAGETPTEATAAALAFTLDRAIGALRRAGQATPTAARRSVGVWAAAVEARVDARLRKAGWFDGRSAGAMVARYVASAPAEALAELGALGSVVLSGVLPWDGDDLLWIEALHRRSRAAGGAGVTLRLPRFSGATRGGGAALGALAGAEDPLARALEKRWGAMVDHPEVTWSDAALARVIAVRGARTASAEARAAAAAVLEALSEGIAPERVAIVAPRVSEEALAPLCAALGEARVPFAEARGRSIVACPDGRAALALMGLAEGPITRDGLLEVLRAPGLHAGLWVEAADEGEAAARVVRLASRLRDVPVDVDGSGRLFVEALATIADDAREGAPDETWMARAMERIVESVRWLAEAGTLREGCKRLVALLDRSKLGQPSARDLAAALGDERRGHGPLATAAMGENASAVRRLREIVMEVGRAGEAMGLGGAPVSAAELRALVSGLAARASARAGGTAARAGAVRIGRPEDLAGLPFDRVVVTGMVDGAYGDDGDEDDDLLASEEEAREGRAAARGARRALALASALASAAEAVLTFATGDEEEARKPHAAVTAAIAEGARVAHEPASRLSPRASVLGPRAAALVALAGGRPAPADLSERVRIERLRYTFFMDPRAGADDFTGSVRVDGELGEVLPRLVGGVSGAASIAVTAIEKAAGCAFAGFARRVLRIQRKEDVAEAGDARERGTLVHRALHVAFEAAREVEERAARGDPRTSAGGATDARRSEGGGGARDAAIAAARAAAESALGIDRIVSPLRKEAIRSAVRDALTVLVRAWDEDEPLRFHLGERTFGPGQPGPWGALELPPDDDDPGPSVFVEGRIDRIDLSPDGSRVRVIDYKTGRLPDGEAKRTLMQLQLYGEAAARALGAKTIEAMYVRVTARGMIEESPKIPSARLVKPEELAQRGREARRAVRGLWEGRIAPRPMFLSMCAGCDARDVCRRPAVMPIEEQEDRS